MEKLVVTIMCQNAERFISMCLKSVEDSDAIVVCDGGSTDGTLDYLCDKGFLYEEDLIEIEDNSRMIIKNPYDQEDKQMNGKQRNFYLDYIKKNYPNYWTLCLDVDEVVGDLNKIKEFIQTAKQGLYSVKMEHFIGNLGFLDNTVPIHYVPNRLFKISCADKYPKVEHPVLQPLETQIFQTDCTTIWHLGYIPNLWEIKKRYDNNLIKSNMHTPEFLKEWYLKHLFGTYPTRGHNFINIPHVILKHFGVNPDEVYFKTHSTLEVKHFVMMEQWKDYFKPKKVLDLGCGVGLFGWAARAMNLDYTGLELSEYAVKNTRIKGILLGDITEVQSFKNYDLVLLLDVIEHLTYEGVDKVLEHIKGYGDKFLFSIPFLGEPNFDEDPTHIVKETRKWWIDKITKHGFKQIETPDYFVFAHQLLIFENERVE